MVELLEVRRPLAQGARKGVEFSERRSTGAGSGVIRLRLNPRYRQLFSGAEITAATVTATGTLLTFRVNGVLDPLIGEYIGNTGATGQISAFDIANQPIQRLIDLVNGLDPGQFENGLPLRRWEAFVADYPPAFPLESTPFNGIGAQDAMLGENDATTVLGQSPVLPGTTLQIQFIAGCGVSALRGGVPTIPLGDELFTKRGTNQIYIGKGGSLGTGGDVARSDFIDRNRNLSAAAQSKLPFGVFVEKIVLTGAAVGDRMFVMDAGANVLWSDRHSSVNDSVYFPKIEVNGPAFVGVASGGVGVDEILVRGEIVF